MIEIKYQKEQYLNTQLTNVFHILSIYGQKSFLIGSSGIRNIIYNNDYDLNENLKIKNANDVLHKLYEEFLSVFNKC
jgi:hypothetical protein